MIPITLSAFIQEGMNVLTTGWIKKSPFKEVEGQIFSNSPNSSNRSPVNACMRLRRKGKCDIEYTVEVIDTK